MHSKLLPVIVVFCVANFCTVASADVKDTFSIERANVLAVEFEPLKPPPPGERVKGRLSPELLALMTFGGRLYGKTDKNVAILGFAEPAEVEKARATEKVPTSLKVKTDGATADRDMEIFRRYIILFNAEKAFDDAVLRGTELTVRRKDARRGRLSVQATRPLSQDTLKKLLNVEMVTYIEPSYEVRIPQEPMQPRGAKQPTAINRNPQSETATEADEQPQSAAASSEVETAIRSLTSNVSSLALNPNDSDWWRLWGMRNIHAPDAWDAVTTSNRIVAVIDSGVNMTHPDLQANLWTNVAETPNDGVDNDGNGFIDDIHGYDFSDGDGNPDDLNSHGTHCAGTIGAVGNDGFGVCGVCWRTRIMCMRFLDVGGSGSTDDAIACINYAVDHGATVLSNSWGGGSFSQALLDAIEDAKLHGAIFVAAAGNSNSDNDLRPFYPSSYNAENLIAVASIDSSNQRSSFSNFGAVSVDLAAPGSWIWSTVPGSSTHDFKSGTSMATPHVAGACALIWSHPDYAGESWKEIIGLVLSNARSVADLSGRCLTGSTLDLIFLAPPIPNAGEAYSHFTAVTLRQAANVEVLTFELDAPMYVHITAGAEVRLSYPSRGKRFRCGFSQTGVLGTVIPDSTRITTVDARNHSSTLTSSLGVKLGAGRHTFYWQIAPVDTRGTVAHLSHGTIMVEAFGRKLGGNLP